MTTLTHPMSRMIEAAMCGNLDDRNTVGNTAKRTTPRADIMEGDTEFRVVLDLPGITVEDLEIQVENQTLSVTAKRNHQIPDGFESSRRERMGEVTFNRNFNLGNAVDSENIDARLENGILMLTLPKSKASMPRRIEVK
jgi:HSP20 family protein